MADKPIDLRAYREQAGRTQNEMAEIFDVTRKTWSRWEANPDLIPAGKYLYIVHVLEQGVQVRKEMNMAGKDYGEVKVVFENPDTAEEVKFDVPLEDGATEDFVPSKPVTGEQVLDYHIKGIEPYEGYEQEYIEWERAQERRLRVQAAKDGSPLPVSDTVQADPEFDPETGLPVAYAGELDVQIDRKSGKAQIAGDLGEPKQD